MASHNKLKISVLRFSLIIIFLSIVLTSNSQKLNGIYKDDNNNPSLIIQDSIVMIEMSNKLYLYGSFIKRSRFLEVLTMRNAYFPSSYYSIIPDTISSDSCEITTADANGNLLVEYSLLQYDKSENYLRGFYLHQSKFAFMRERNASFLSIGKSGYMAIDIPLDSVLGKKIKVSLFPGIMYPENRKYKLKYKLEKDFIVLGPLIPIRTCHENIEFVFGRIRTRLNQFPWKWGKPIKDISVLNIEFRKTLP
ncbi:MAG: hypothetical protein U0T82_02505 [Bacteroidales bacterium]